VTGPARQDGGKARHLTGDIAHRGNTAEWIREFHSAGDGQVFSECAG